MKKLLMILPVLALFLSQCSFSIGSKTFTDPGCQCSVSTNMDWKKHGKLLNNAQIQIHNPKTEAYFAVLAEDIANFPTWNSLQYAEAAMPRFLKIISGDFDYKFKPVTLNGTPAVQSMLRSAMKNRKVVFYHTALRGKNKMYQLVMWTPEDKFKKNEKVLHKVLANFKEKDSNDK